MVANSEASAGAMLTSSILSLSTTLANEVSSVAPSALSLAGTSPGGGLTVLKSTDLVTLSLCELLRCAVAKAASPPVTLLPNNGDWPVVSLADLPWPVVVLLPRLANWDSDRLGPVLGVVKPLVKSKLANCGFILSTGEVASSRAEQEASVDVNIPAGSDSDKSLDEQLVSCCRPSKLVVCILARSDNDKASVDDDEISFTTTVLLSLTGEDKLATCMLARSLSDNCDNEL